MGLQCRIEYCSDVGHGVLDFVNAVVGHTSQSCLSHVNSRYVARSQRSSWLRFPNNNFVGIRAHRIGISCSIIFIIYHRSDHPNSLSAGRILRSRSAISEDWRRSAGAPHRPITSRLCISVRNVEGRNPARRDIAPAGSHDMHCRHAVCKLV